MLSCIEVRSAQCCSNEKLPRIYSIVFVFEGSKKKKKKAPLMWHCVVAHATPCCGVFVENCWWKRACGNSRRTLGHTRACLQAAWCSGTTVESRVKWHLVADAILTPPALFLGCPISPINFSEGPPTPESLQQRKKKKWEKKSTAASHL